MYDEMIHNVVSDVVYLFLTPNLGIDIRKGNGLATLFNTIHDLRFILNKPETNIAQLAMVIMRINEIEFMSIITIQVGQMFASGVLN